MTETAVDISGYAYEDGDLNPSHDYLVPALLEELASLGLSPAHGYRKNLALALTVRLDHHFTALWDHGHIKFWSMATLRQLLQEAGFHSSTFRRVGRVPALAKSMIAIAKRS